MKYEISNGTLAVVPNDNNSSVVYEDEERYIIEELPFKIMEDSCKYFGSSYEGRKKGAKEILGAEYKVPIVIADTNELIAFPTTSPRADDCAWISVGRIENIYRVDESNTRIVFDNKKEIIVPCSLRSMENQIARATRLKNVLSKRKNS